MKNLIIIGSHKQELLFGELLKEYMKKNRFSEFEFYSVKNNCNNMGNGGTDTEHIKAFKEICRELLDKKPDLSVDIHTGHGMNHTYRAEIWTPYPEKVASLEKIDSGCYLTEEESVRIIKINADKNLLPQMFENQDNHIIGLEIMIDNFDFRPPYEKPIKFAANLINKIAEKYS